MGHFLKRIYFVHLVPYWKKGLLLLGCFTTMIAFNTIFPLGIKFLIDMPITPQNSHMLRLLIGGDDDDLEHILLANSKKFQAILDAAEQRIKETGGISHEDLWAAVEAETKTR